MGRYQHTETDHQRITTLELESEDKANEVREQYADQGIKVIVKSDDGIDQEFYALDFKTITDAASDPILHIKFKKDLVLYLTTSHPDSRKCLEDLNTAVQIASWKTGQTVEIRDFTLDIKETLQATKHGMKGFKDGVHPQMGYVKEAQHG